MAIASWYTYGLAGAFWIYDIYHGLSSTNTRVGAYDEGWGALRRRWWMTLANVATFVGGGFICVAGLYAIIKAIVLAYESGTVGTPFSC